MLFSESLELWKGDKTKMHTRDEYKDKNIAYNNPCEMLFDYYALDRNDSDIYFDSKKDEKSCEERERELSQREMLYRLFKKEYERGMQFFIESAPEVVWNYKNYCNLVGGHHRTSYLLHEGQTLFPVKMSYDDFNKWCNKDVYEDLKKYIYEHHIERFYAPLPHPGFLNFPVQWENIGRTKLADTMRYFADKDLFDLTVLDCSDDEGYFARNMIRIGAKEAVFLNDDERQIELAGIFNRLLYREDVQIKKDNLENYSKNNTFDIVFAVHDDNMRPESSELQLKLLGMLCKQCLITETIKPEEIENIKKCTGLRDYMCIHREYKDGQVWELGAYSL